jgi:signal transduction histidine kinase
VLYADTERRHLLVMGGLLAWLGLSAHHLMEVALSPSLRTAPDRLACTLALALFGLAYAAASLLPLSPRGGLALLGVQTALGLWLSWYPFGAFTAIHVITTTQACFLLSRRASLYWVLAQSAGAGIVLLLRPDMDLGASLSATLMFISFNFFALFAAHAMRDEAYARAELAHVNTQLLRAQAALAEHAREQERLQISGELHDSVGHHLTALALHLEVACHSPSETSAAQVREARNLVGQVLDEIRAVVAEMRGEHAPPLAVRLRALAGRSTPPRVSLSLPDPLEVEDPRVAHALYRCAQETLTNATRHARANTLRLHLRQDDTHVYLEAQDDGQGAPQLVPNTGLRVMRERVEQLGGQLELASPPGEGLRVRVRLPLRGP